MTSASQIGRALSRLLIEALESPATVDRTGLLSAATAFLDVAHGADAHLPVARRMAGAAMQWAVFNRPEDYAKFERASAIFIASSQMHH
jgi:hypothetical protein